VEWREGVCGGWGGVESPVKLKVVSPWGRRCLNARNAEITICRTWTDPSAEG
jgi:hypothetical protein